MKYLKYILNVEENIEITGIEKILFLCYTILKIKNGEKNEWS